MLYAFTGGSDGGIPYAGLIADSAGNLYGTTPTGRRAAECGMVFKLSPDGTRRCYTPLRAAQRRELSLCRSDCGQRRQSLWHDR